MLIVVAYLINGRFNLCWSQQSLNLINPEIADPNTPVIAKMWI